MAQEKIEDALVRRRNLQIFFTGQMVSRIGQTLQLSVIGLQAYQISQSAKVLGIVIGFGMLPYAFLLFFSGVIVDRYRKQKVLYITQGIYALLSMVLMSAVMLQGTTIGLLIAITIAQSLVGVVDRPAQRTLMIQITKPDLAMGLALNPALLAISWLGSGMSLYTLSSLTNDIGWSYAVSTISTLYMLATVRTLNLQPSTRQSTNRPGIIDGWRAVVRVKNSLILICMLMAFAALGYTIRDLLPVALGILHAGSSVLGIWIVAFALGILGGSWWLYTGPSKHTYGTLLVIQFLFILAGAQALLMMAITSKTLAYVPFALFVIGVVTTLACNIIESMIVQATSPSMRGHVLGVVTAIFCLGMFMGNIVLGWLTDTYNFVGALYISTVLTYLLMRFVLERHDTEERREFSKFARIRGGLLGILALLFIHLVLMFMVIALVYSFARIII